MNDTERHIAELLTASDQIRWFIFGADPSLTSIDDRKEYVVDFSFCSWARECGFTVQGKP